MTMDEKIRAEKLQYDANRKEAKISALSSGKTSKYERLTGKKYTFCSNSNDTKS